MKNDTELKEAEADLDLVREMLEDKAPLDNQEDICLYYTYTKCSAGEAITINDLVTLFSTDADSDSFKKPCEENNCVECKGCVYYTVEEIFEICLGRMRTMRNLLNTCVDPKGETDGDKSS